MRKQVVVQEATEPGQNSGLMKKGDNTWVD